MTDPVRILVAENELLIQSFIEEALAGGGFEAEMARSGEEVFSLFTERGKPTAPC